MPISSSLLPILRCPFCDTSFEFEERPRPEQGAAEFGILHCGTHEFPVVDGIPIIQRSPVGMFEHTRGTAQVKGIAVHEVVRLIESGETLMALLECLAVPVLPAVLWRALGWRLSHSHAAVRFARQLGRNKFKAQVLSSRNEVSAREVFEFYYQPGGPLDPELGHYFVRRFGQPRHVAALALAALIDPRGKPVLDIACGAGHLDHYLTQRGDNAAVVGLDLNFYHLWVAQHWIAPSAHFVCANAGEGLPFRNDTFSATLCSDAYHYIAGRKSLLSEIDRCAPGRPVVLTRVGNAAVMPNEGHEDTLEGYLHELGPMYDRAFDESELVRGYLRRQNPFVQPSRGATELGECKWLSFVLNASALARQQQTGGADWPHAVGELGLNPIYTPTPGPGGNLRLRFEFPSVGYAYENHGMLAYHPAVITVARAQLSALPAGREDAELSKLVESFVLLGMPRRFVRRLPG